MRDIIHLMIIILMIPWIMMILGSVLRQSGRSFRTYRIWCEGDEKKSEMNTLREEHKQFRDQVLDELRRNREATEKQNEILNHILERMGGEAEQSATEEPQTPPEV